MQKLFVLIGLLCFLISGSHAAGLQRNRNLKRDQVVAKRPNEIFFHSLGTDFYLQATAPFRMNGRQSFEVLGGIVSIVGLIAIDKPIDNQISPLKKRYGWLEKASPLVSELGGPYVFAGAGVFAAYGFLFNEAKAKQTSSLLAEALITTTIWSRLGKLITSRQRPRDSYNVPIDDDPGGEWFGPIAPWTKAGRKISGSNYDAFPSGHTTTAFAIATVFAMQYKENITVPIISYSLASLVGFSRMTEHEHWASDVLAGGLLGYLCAKEICSHATSVSSPTVKRKTSVQYFAGYSKSTLYASCNLRF